MGLTHKNFMVKEGRKSSASTHINFLIDSGVVYSLVPEQTLRKLGVEPYKEMDFILADGTKVHRKVGDAYFEYQADGGMAPVIFGEPGDEPLLGATTLESLGLVLNPFKRDCIR
jgi:clan AA aspartic protease